MSEILHQRTYNFLTQEDLFSLPCVSKTLAPVISLHSRTSVRGHGSLQSCPYLPPSDTKQFPSFHVGDARVMRPLNLLLVKILSAVCLRLAGTIPRLRQRNVMRAALRSIDRNANDCVDTNGNRDTTN